MIEQGQPTLEQILMAIAGAITDLAGMQKASLEKQDAILEGLAIRSRAEQEREELSPEEKAALSKSQREQFDPRQVEKTDQDKLDESPMVEIWHASPVAKTIGFGLARKYTLTPGRNVVPQIIAQIYVDALQGEASDKTRMQAITNRMVPVNIMERVINEGRKDDR